MHQINLVSDPIQWHTHQIIYNLNKHHAKLKNGADAEFCTPDDNL